MGNEVNEEVTTGENGQIEKKLLPGTYLVKELPVDRYVTPSAPVSYTHLSAIPEGAFTPEGTGTVQDNISGTDGEKQFYTITTDAGNVFYH